MWKTKGASTTASRSKTPKIRLPPQIETSRVAFSVFASGTACTGVSGVGGVAGELLFMEKDQKRK
jgi:hypothetical protein